MEQIENLVGDAGTISIEEIMNLIDQELTEDQAAYFKSILPLVFKGAKYGDDLDDFVFNEDSLKDFVNFMSTFDINGVDMIQVNNDIQLMSALTTASSASLSMDDIMDVIDDMDAISDEDKIAIENALQKYGYISSDDLMDIIEQLKEIDDLEDIDWVLIGEKLINAFPEGTEDIPIKEVLDIIKENTTPEQYEKLIKLYLEDLLVDVVLFSEENLKLFLSENDISVDDVTKENLKRIITEKMNRLTNITMEDVKMVMEKNLTPEQMSKVQVELTKFVYLSELADEKTVKDFMELLKLAVAQLLKKGEENLNTIFKELDGLMGEELTMVQVMTVAEDKLSKEQLSKLDKQLHQYQKQILAQSNNVKFNADQVIDMMDFLQNTLDKNDLANVNFEKINEAIIEKISKGKISLESVLDVIEREVNNEKTYSIIEKQIGNYVSMQLLSQKKFDSKDIDKMISYLSENAEGDFARQINWDEIKDKVKVKMAESGYDEMMLEDLIELIMSTLKSAKYGIMEDTQAVLLNAMYENPEMVAEFHEQKAKWDAIQNGEELPVNQGPSIHKPLPPKAHPNLRGNSNINDRETPEIANEEAEKGKPYADIKQIPGSNPDLIGPGQSATGNQVSSTKSEDIESEPEFFAMIGGLFILVATIFYAASRLYTNYSMNKYENMSDEENIDTDNVYTKKKKNNNTKKNHLSADTDSQFASVYMVN